MFKKIGKMALLPLVMFSSLSAGNLQKGDVVTIKAGNFICYDKKQEHLKWAANSELSYLEARIELETDPSDDRGFPTIFITGPNAEFCTIYKSDTTLKFNNYLDKHPIFDTGDYWAYADPRSIVQAEETTTSSENKDEEKHLAKIKKYSIKFKPRYVIFCLDAKTVEYIQLDVYSKPEVQKKFRDNVCQEMKADNFANLAFDTNTLPKKIHGAWKMEVIKGDVSFGPAASDKAMDVYVYSSDLSYNVTVNK